jgi:class 3 adenylate cyclase
MHRFEPLTICAPVSEARRLCELARRGGSPVMASERALARASSAEAARWPSAG